MSADLLREAAAKLRESAEAATPGPWVRGITDGIPDRMIASADGRFVATVESGVKVAGADAAYIALVHPTVGLALADWLAECARLWEYGDVGPLMWKQANTVARAYLGGES